MLSYVQRGALLPPRCQAGAVQACSTSRERTVEAVEVHVHHDARRHLWEPFGSSRVCRSHRKGIMDGELELLQRSKARVCSVSRPRRQAKQRKHSHRNEIGVSRL